MPSLTRSIAEFPRFVQETREALAALRDRPMMSVSDAGVIGDSPHPWKVTSNGDDTVSVNEGKVSHWLIGEPDEGAALAVPVSYEGTDSHQVTNSGTSYLYAKIPIATAQVAGGTSNRQLSATVTITDEPNPPSGVNSEEDVWLLLAELELSDGVVSVTEQKLDHNPVVSIQDNSGADPTHPWKATENGDDTITVADGKVIYFTGQTSSFGEPNSPYDGYHLEYSSTDIPITASGTLYLVITGTSSNDVPTSADTTSGLTILNMQPEYIDVNLDPILSGHELSIPVAEVTLDSSGIATVDKQILEHNPVMSLQWGEVN